GLSPANEDFPKLLDRLKTASAPYGFVANTIPVIAASQAAMIRQQIATLDKRLAADSQHYAAVSKSITSMKTEIAGHAAQTASALGNLRTELAALAKRSVNEQKAAMTQIATLEKTAAGLASNTKQLGKSVSALAGQTKALDKARGDLAKRIDTLADIQSRINSPHLRLARLLRSTAIFFSNELDIGDGAKAGKSIAAIASAMQEAGSSIRVIGHADATGTDSKNRKLALQRAQMIAGMLVRAGAPKDRLIVIERGTSYPIAANDGPRVTRNRRVTFEPVYEGETK
ncbi:MAG: OmpA family protein, partial [Hyphomicrobiales bacterium]|nr:OmpA family protein [Hyphomicrobiales bacterium]